MTIFDKLRTETANVSMEAISMEADVQVEEELVFYARITDIAALKALATKEEEQEQWEIKSPVGNGRFRIRKTIDLVVESKFQHLIDANSPKYTLTTKLKRSEGGDVETTADIDGDIFESFKALCPNGMRKTRYEVPTGTPGYTWEFDVYEGTDWCKVDLELPQPGEQRVRMSWISQLSELPFVDGVMTNSNEADKDAIWALYENYFISKNPLTQKVSTEGIGSAIGKFLFGEPIPSLEEDDETFKFLAECFAGKMDFETKSGTVKANFFANDFKRNGEITKNFVQDFNNNVNQVVKDTHDHFKVISEYDKLCVALVEVMRKSEQNTIDKDHKEVTALLGILNKKLPAQVIKEQKGVKNYLGDTSFIQTSTAGTAHIKIDLESPVKTVEQKDHRSRKNAVFLPALTKDQINAILPSCEKLAQLLADLKVTYKTPLVASGRNESDVSNKNAVCGKKGKSFGDNKFIHLSTASDKAVDNYFYMYNKHFGKDLAGSHDHYMDIAEHLGEYASICLFEDEYIEHQLHAVARYIKASVVSTKDEASQ